MLKKTLSHTSYSKENFLGLKGYLALCVLIHHLYQFTGFFSNTNVGYAFLLLGHWAVIGFIFLSGYGLYTSYRLKGEGYIRSFPRTRLFPFYVTYLVFVATYVVYEFIGQQAVTATALLRSLTYGSTIVSFGWYFQLTYVMYLFFYTEILSK